MSSKREYPNHWAKHYLGEVRNLYNEIAVHDEVLDKIKATPQKLTASYSPTPKTLRPRDIGDIVAESMDEQSRQQSRIHALIMRRKRAQEEVASLSNSLYRELLTDYYVNAKTWEDIAVRKRYSYRQVMRIKEEALEEFERCHRMSH